MELDSKHVLTLLNSINLLLSGVLAIAYINSSKLRRHPGTIILSLAICEVLSSFHGIINLWGANYVVSQLEINRFQIWKLIGLSPYIDKITCEVNVVLVILGVIGGVLYNIILALDLFLSLRNPFSQGFKRMWIYHILVGISVIGLVAYISLDETNELCAKFSKETQSDKKIIDDENALILLRKHFYIMLPILLAYLLIGLITIFFSIYSFKTVLKFNYYASERKSILRYIVYVTIHICLMTYFTLFIIFDKFYNDQINFMRENKIIGNDVMALGGLILAIIRCLDSNLRSKIFGGNLFSKDQEEIDQNDDEWNKSTIEVFKELKSQTSSQIFDCLWTVYNSDPPESVSNFTDRYSKNVKTFKKNLHSNTSNFISENNEISCTVKHLCPELFLSIINESGLSYNSMRESINPVSNLTSIIQSSESTGKSGSFFFTTYDEKFIIKLVKKCEIESLAKVAVRYEEYLKHNKKTYICKIFGAFVINFPGLSQINLVIMENIMFGIKPSLIYDLKGSLLGRFTKSDPNNPVGPFKDLDFLKKGKKVLSKEFNSKQLESDCKFLASCNFMDYSLLLVIIESEDKQEEHAIYEYKIIDYLIEYELGKKLERVFTYLMNPRSINKASVIDSKSYSERFFHFMIKKVFHRHIPNGSLNAS